MREQNVHQHVAFMKSLIFWCLVDEEPSRIIAININHLRPMWKVTRLMLYLHTKGVEKSANSEFLPYCREINYQWKVGDFWKASNNKVIIYKVHNQSHRAAGWRLEINRWVVNCGSRWQQTWVVNHSSALIIEETMKLLKVDYKIYRDLTLFRCSF